MSIKIKISWDDNNAVSEGVRIYRSDTEFTSSQLPAVIATVPMLEEYEDFEVEEGRTYFYMLSCFMVDQEVFTECYEVFAEDSVDLLILNLPSLVSKPFKATIQLSGQFIAANTIVFNNISGDFLVGGVITSGTYGVKRFNSSKSLLEIFTLPYLVDSITMSENGRRLFVRSGITIYEYTLQSAFTLNGAVLAKTIQDYAGISVDNASTIFVNPKVTLSKEYLATNLILTKLTSSYNLQSIELNQNVNILSKLTLRNSAAKITGMLMSKDGGRLWITTGSWGTTNQRFHDLYLSNAFDLSSSVESNYKDLTQNFTRGTPIGFNSISNFIAIGDANGSVIKLQF